MTRIPFFAAALGALLSAPLSAQVVVNEVLANPAGTDAGSEWIEVANLGPTSVPLFGWVVCLNTPLPFPQDRAYWVFPGTQTLPGGGILRVHWKASGLCTGADLFTESCGFWNFAFPTAPDLHNVEGAVALYANPIDFTNPAFLVDFLEYGAGGQLREPVAVAAGMWTAGDFVPNPSFPGDFPEGRSIAHDGFGDSSADYFRDASPTLGTPNAPGASASISGAGCPVSGGTLPAAASNGPAAIGNESFALTLSGAGANHPTILLLAPALSAIPLAFQGCSLWLDPVSAFPIPSPSSNLQGNATLPSPIPSDAALVGGVVHSQWAVIDLGAPNGLFGASAVHSLTVGG